MRQSVFSIACETHRNVGAEVKAFIQNVPNVKEESITDYLMWRWAVADPHFQYMRAGSYSRFEENTQTGADFEIEIWIVSDMGSLPLLFQAKKLTKDLAGYWQRLAYPKSTKQQLTMLLGYSQQVGRLPFYAFYADIDHPSGSMCQCGAAYDSGVFIADAHKINSLVDALPRRQISKADLIRVSSPFHCLFCCPLKSVGYLSLFVEFPQLVERKTLPSYAAQLLPGALADGLELRGADEFPQSRLIGVYDVRSESDGHRNSKSST